MHAVALLASALSLNAAPGPETAPTRAVCCVTGLEGPCVPRGAVMDNGFTQQAQLRAPLSPWLSVDAARVLRYRPERSSSWWCDGATFLPLRRPDVRRFVIEAPPTSVRWAGYVTTSYKKHGAFGAPVNVEGRAVWLFETRLADCSDRSTVVETWARLRAMQDAGCPRPVLETLDASPWLIGKLGAARWLAFERWARPRVQGGLYQLCSYLLPSKDERRAAT
jgi:hypothetical protein